MILIILSLSLSVYSTDPANLAFKKVVTKFRFLEAVGERQIARRKR